MIKITINKTYPILSTVFLPNLSTNNKPEQTGAAIRITATITVINFGVSSF